MADTSTLEEFEERLGKLADQYSALLEAATQNGLSLGQYTDSVSLAKLVDGFESLLDECNNIEDRCLREKVRSKIVELLYPTETALTDAYLYECDQEADYKYSSDETLHIIEL